MPRILIIDDKETVRETLGVYSEMLDCEPLFAEDPTSCSIFHSDNQKYSKEHPCADIHLIDQFLPTTFGLDFIERQTKKGCKASAHCKAIMAEALIEEEFTRAKEIGCHVLQKPVTYEILENWLKEIETTNQTKTILSSLALNEA